MLPLKVAPTNVGSLDTAESVKPVPLSTSVKTEDTSTAADVPSPFTDTSAIGFITVGASLTALTVIATVAGADCSTPSETTNVRLSGPDKLGLGVYVLAAPVPVNVPRVGGVTIV